MKTANLQKIKSTAPGTNKIPEQLRIIASSHDGKCLSSDYKSKKDKLFWECKKGHKWYASVNSVLYSGSWCPYCAGNRKLSLTELRQLARQKGGKCLATQYVNSKTKILWQCKNGHQWYASALSIKVRKSWCPVCAGNQPLGIRAMYKLAEENEGKCLSATYGNCKTKMLWQCRNGHQFQSTPDNIKQGKWCPYCRVATV